MQQFLLAWDIYRGENKIINSSASMS